MNATVNEVKKPFAVSKKVAQKIEDAKKYSDEQKVVFVAATFRTIERQENVRVTIPAKTAKYMNFIQGHTINVFNENITELSTLNVSGHYVHGDFPLRNDEGKVTPRVIRHFNIDEGVLGKEIVADVELKEKTCLLTGKKTVIIDIVQLLAGEFISEHVLRLGVIAVGLKGEVPITESNLCVRFEKIAPKTMYGKDPVKKEEVEEKTETPKEIAPVDAAPANEKKPRFELKKKSLPEVSATPEANFPAPVLRKKLQFVKHKQNV